MRKTARCKMKNYEIRLMMNNESNIFVDDAASIAT